MSALPDPLELAALRGCRVARQLVDASGGKLRAISLRVESFGLRGNVTASVLLSGEAEILLAAGMVVGAEFTRAYVPDMEYSARLTATVEGVELVACYHPVAVAAWVPLAEATPETVATPAATVAA